MLSYHQIYLEAIQRDRTTWQLHLATKKFICRQISTLLLYLLFIYEPDKKGPAMTG